MWRCLAQAQRLPDSRRCCVKRHPSSKTRWVPLGSGAASLWSRRPAGSLSICSKQAQHIHAPAMSTCASVALSISDCPRDGIPFYLQAMLDHMAGHDEWAIEGYKVGVVSNIGVGLQCPIRPAWLVYHQPASGYCTPEHKPYLGAGQQQVPHGQGMHLQDSGSAVARESQWTGL